MLTVLQQKWFSWLKACIYKVCNLLEVIKTTWGWVLSVIWGCAKGEKRGTHSCQGWAGMLGGDQTVSRYGVEDDSRVKNDEYSSTRRLWAWVRYPCASPHGPILVWQGAQWQTQGGYIPRERLWLFQTRLKRPNVGQRSKRLQMWQVSREFLKERGQYDNNLQRSSIPRNCIDAFFVRGFTLELLAEEVRAVVAAQMAYSELRESV